LTRRICTIVGARPQFIKAFPLSQAFADSAEFDEIMIHTGQHFDRNMSEVFFTELGISRPKYNLGINTGTHGTLTGRMLESIEIVLLSERPDAVVVFGDTDSTLAGALAASKLYFPLIHVEAGLRSFNRHMPEEINRVVVDHVCNVLLCPTTASVDNLTREGITKGVHKVGDLMYDAVLIGTKLAAKHSSIVRDLGLKRKAYGVATIHRAQNTNDLNRLAQVLEFIAEQAKKQRIIFPLHPRTRAAARAAKFSLARKGVEIIEPVGYLDMCQLLNGAAVVLTDSGGMQKEAYFHRVPCVTLRTETEWVETIEHGWNRLWSDDDYLPRRDIAEYGDGHAAQAILDILRKEIGGTRAWATALSGT
jgi:UDP-GlcNAc3NAcA epimerase